MEKGAERYWSSKNSEDSELKLKEIIWTDAINWIALKEKKLVEKVKSQSCQLKIRKEK